MKSRLKTSFETLRSHPVALALVTSFALCPATFAKKGGGGNGGGGDPPPPDPLPIRYSITWLTEDPDDSLLWDIDSNGVAVGQVRPNGSSADRYGIVSFPGRAVTDLGALVTLPADWQLTAVITISDGLLVGGDLVDPDGTMHCFAAQLADDGVSTSVTWFEIYPAPANLTRAYLMDASEDGDDFALDVMSTGPGGETIREIRRWSPRNAPQQAPSLVTSISQTLVAVSTNNAGQVCWSVADNGGRDVFLDVPGAGIIAVDDDPRFYSNGLDLGEDGSVVGAFTGSRKGSLKPGVWRQASGWEEVGSGSRDGGQVTSVNSSLQMVGRANGRLFHYSAADGLHQIDDLVDGTIADLARWEDTSYYGYAPRMLSDADGTGYGSIVGYGGTGSVGNYQAFILTPVVVSP